MYWNQSETPEYTPGEQQALQCERLSYNKKEAKNAGVLIDTNGLAPAASATTIRVREGKALTTDGPFAETHEQMGVGCRCSILPTPRMNRRCTTRSLTTG